MIKLSEKTWVFDEPKAIRINKARLKHLGSLGLDFSGRKVIDVGCGVGHLAQFFLKNNCDVLGIDGRKENIISLRARYPKLKGRVADVESEDFSKYGNFDVVFCYGLLYHTKKPDYVIKNLSRICKELMLIETCIVDSDEFEVQLVKDTQSVNQALAGVGCRPSPRFVISHLRANGFGYVYVPRVVPKHPDFLFKYRADKTHLKDGHLIRQIFIASRTKLVNDKLTPVFDGHELYRRDFLSKLPSLILKSFAQFIYRPREISNIFNWHTGLLEGNLNGYRTFLKRLWELLEIKMGKPRRLTILWYNKAKLTIDLESEISRCVFVEGVYEPLQFLFLSRFLKKEMKFVDVGANIGLYSVFAASIVGEKGRVFCFEPSRREYRLLRQNARRFKKVIRSFEYAVGEKNHWAKLHVANNFYSGHNTLGEFIYDAIKPIRVEKVKTITLDWFFKKHPVSSLDVLKIDVEGHEMKVILGAIDVIKKFKPLILVEVSNLEPLKFLRKFGYHFYTFNKRSGLIGKLTSLKAINGTENIIASYQVFKP